MRKYLALSISLLFVGLLCLVQQPSQAFWQSRDSNYNISINVVPTNPPSANLWFWLDGTNSYTETSGTPTTIITVDGTAIGSQLDLSGNARHAYKNGFAPTFKTSILNGFPSARFSGAGLTQLLTSTAPSGNSFSMYVVANQTAYTTPYDGLLSNNDAGISPRYSLLDNGGGPSMRVFNGGDGANATLSINAYHLIAGTADNTGSFPTQLQIDNNTLSTANATGGGGLGTGVSIGLFFNGYWTGDVLEVLLYTSVHSFNSGDGLLARQYLNGKYNLGLPF